MGSHMEGNKIVSNTLADLILRCELVILSSNSNHVEHDLFQACELRSKLNRNNVVLACLAGSFCQARLLLWQVHSGVGKGREG